MAVDLGNSVLSKAQETLQILQDFDSTVEENRADFEAIMQETNAIEVIFSDNFYNDISGMKMLYIVADI